MEAVKYLPLLSTLPRRHRLKYLLGGGSMDNYFTPQLVVVVAMTRRLNVGLVGTARRQRGFWPPQEEYEDIVDWRYSNSLYKIPCEKDDQKYIMLMIWIDNGVVDMVSTVHTVFGLI
jgi:hypothetical protein